MVDMETLRAAAERLATASSAPTRVILFGSYVRGTAEEGSDVDLMVIEKDIPDRAAEYLRLREALGRVATGTGVDLLLYPLDEFERRSQVPGTLHYEVRLEGKVLHDTLH